MDRGQRASNYFQIHVYMSLQRNLRKPRRSFTEVCQIISALVLKIFYNVCFLHKGIPTKFWLSATDWGFWREVQIGKPYALIASLHCELGMILLSLLFWQSGDAVRIQPNHICFNNIEAFEEIYGQNTKTRKGGFYSMVGGKPPSIFTELYRLTSFS